MLWVVIEVVLGIFAWAVVHIVTRLLNRTRTPHRDRRHIEQRGRTGGGSRASLPVVSRRRRLTAGERSEREKGKEGKEKEKDKGKEKEKGKEREVATMTTTTRSTAAPGKETRRRGHRHTQAIHQVTDEDMRHHHDYEEEEDEDAEGEPRRVREMPIVVPPSQRGIQSRSQPEAKQTGKLRYGVGTLKGRRRTMEDQHCALVGSLLSSRPVNRTSTAPFTSTEGSTTTTTTTSTTTSTPSFSFFGVYDGHAGNEVSDYLSRHLHARVAEELQRAIEEIGGEELWVSKLSPTERLGRRESVFVDAFRKIDAELRAERLNAGSTVVCVLVEETDRDKRVSDEGEAKGEKEKEEEGIKKEEERGGEVCIHCANLGDSRCVISFFNDPEKVIPLSEEHKPTKPDEMKRIHAAGHIVMRARINSTIAVSRALGDFEWKGNKDCDDRSQAVSNYPDSKEIIVPSDEAAFLLILACDGLWDVLTNEEAVKFVYDKIDAQKKAATTEDGYVNLHQIAQELVAHAVVNMGSADNVSVILVTYNLQ